MSDTVSDTCASEIALACLPDGELEAEWRDRFIRVDQLEHGAPVQEIVRRSASNRRGVTAPAPELRMFDGTSPNRVEIHVHEGCGELIAGSHALRIEPAVEEVASSLVSVVEVVCVWREEPLHPASQIRRWRPDHHVEMSVQQTEREARPPMPQHGSSEALEERSAVDIVSYERFASAALRDDVMNRACEVLTGSTRHG